MTQSQHTQGPWIYTEINIIKSASSDALWKDSNIASLYGFPQFGASVDKCHVMLKANAQLIAAAPEMLDALTYLKARLSEMVADELPALLEEGPTSELILSRLDSYTAKIDDVINKAKGETAQC